MVTKKFNYKSIKYSTTIYYIYDIVLYGLRKSFK